MKTLHKKKKPGKYCCYEDCKFDNRQPDQIPRVRFLAFPKTCVCGSQLESGQLFSTSLCFLALVQTVTFVQRSVL